MFGAMRSRMLRKTLEFTIIGLIGFVLLIQLVPYGRDHSNPPVVQEPHWDDPRTR